MCCLSWRLIMRPMSFDVRTRAWLFAASALAAWVSLTGLAQARPHIFFDDETTGSIGRANLNGSHVQRKFIPHANPAATPNDLAVEGAHVYWIKKAGSLWRALTDGSHAEKIVGGVGQSVTVGGDHVFWGDDVNGPTIGIAAPDGSGANHDWLEDPFNTETPWGLAVDPLGSAFIFWDTSSREIFYAQDPQSPSPFRSLNHDTEGLAVDHNSGYLYWANDRKSGGNIGRTPDNQGPPHGAQERFIKSPHVTVGVAVHGRHIYWTDGFGDIARARLNGSHIQPDFINLGFTPSGGANGIAVSGN
jgi:hypothetical protein